MRSQGLAFEITDNCPRLRCAWELNSGITFRLNGVPFLCWSKTGYLGVGIGKSVVRGNMPKKGVWLVLPRRTAGTVLGELR